MERTNEIMGGIALAAVLALGVGACSSGGGGGSSASGADNGQVAQHCYATVSDAFGNSVTLAAIGTSDCTTVASDVQDSMPPGFTATPNTSKGPGTAACMGTVDTYPVSVIDPNDNPQNAVCSDLGFASLP